MSAWQESLLLVAKRNTLSSKINIRKNSFKFCGHFQNVKGSLPSLSHMPVSPASVSYAQKKKVCLLYRDIPPRLNVYINTYVFQLFFS